VGISSRAAIWSFCHPSAARRMTLARTTSRYGAVYFRATVSNARRSVGASSITNGDDLGIDLDLKPGAVYQTSRAIASV